MTKLKLFFVALVIAQFGVSQGFVQSNWNV